MTDYTQGDWTSQEMLYEIGQLWGDFWHCGDSCGCWYPRIRRVTCVGCSGRPATKCMYSHIGPLFETVWEGTFQSWDATDGGSEYAALRLQSSMELMRKCNELGAYIDEDTRDEIADAEQTQ